jgi:hypothetical protein
MPKVKSSPRETVISARPHSQGAQIIVGVKKIAMGNQEGTGLILDRDTFEVKADIIKLTPSTGGTGVVIDETPINPELYLADKYSADFLNSDPPPVYRSRSIFMVSQALKTAKKMCPILSILRSSGDEIQLSNQASAICGFIGRIDEIIDVVKGYIG